MIRTYHHNGRWYLSGPDWIVSRPSLSRRTHDGLRFPRSVLSPAAWPAEHRPPAYALDRASWRKTPGLVQWVLVESETIRACGYRERGGRGSGAYWASRSQADICGCLDD